MHSNPNMMCLMTSDAVKASLLVHTERMGGVIWVLQMLWLMKFDLKDSLCLVMRSLETTFQCPFGICRNKDS